MAPLWLALCTFLRLAAVGRSVTIREIESDGRAEYEEVPEWVQNVSRVLDVEGIESPEKKTAIVTFAGKRNIEYIDGAVMLGLSIQKHLPGYPRVAMVIEAMKDKHKELLTNASWTLVEVPNWDREYCGESCDMEFLGRWHDSFEKINTFRLPFKRVLFMDSDTYIFDSSIKALVKEVKLPHGHILMAKDGCKEEYNSGVMLYRPDLNIFTDMLKLVTKRQREEILDQNLINEVYRDKIVPMAPKFNCVDTLGFQPGLSKPCDIHCSKDVVVAHFTGHPKPTAPKRRLLELVRRPGSPAIACVNTNYGSCEKWSAYYCDIREHSKMLSKDIQYWIRNTGDCCHKPFDPDLDSPSCQECPTALTVDSGERDIGEAAGTYLQTNITSKKYNGGRPIYLKQGSEADPVYMYFVQEQVYWMIGHSYTSNRAVAYATKEAQCPRDASGWDWYDGMKFARIKLSVKAAPGHGDSPHITQLARTTKTSVKADIGDEDSHGTEKKDKKHKQKAEKHAKQISDDAEEDSEDDSGLDASDRMDVDAEEDSEDDSGLDASDRMDVDAEEDSEDDSGLDASDRMDV